MRVFALAMVVVLLGGVAVGGPARADEAPPDGPREWVSVQLRTHPGGAPVRAAGNGRSPAPSLDEQGFARLPVPPGRDAEEYARELSRRGDIEAAWVSGQVFAALAPDDPFYAGSQAGYLGVIGAAGGWDIATGRNTVTVAIIDSGIDVTHPEFAGRLWENPADANGNGQDSDGNGCIDDRYGCRFITNITPARQTECGYTSSAYTGAIVDDNGKPGTTHHSHGTLVAGILAATGNNGTGIAGVDWNVRIMPVKVLDCGTTGNGGSPSGDMDDVARAIDYARRMGANVINVSLASRPNDPAADTPMLRAAIEAARDDGVIIVAAAGNFAGQGVGLPAAYTQYENVVAVGAASTTGGVGWASYSGYGPAIDFAAPGNDIAGTTRTDIGVDPPYGSDRGTSFATPLVSGAFTLMMARNSRLTMADYIQIARDAATPAPEASHGGNWAGAGIINIGAALQRVPMLITGGALHDWSFIQPGRTVRAIVDGRECGTTTTEAFGPVVRFSIRVLAHAVRTGCGQPGKTVTVFLDGKAGQPAFTWGGKDADLALVNRDVSSVTPPPGAIVVQRLGNGWSLAAHLTADASLPAGVSYLPGSWTEVRQWQPDGAGGGTFLRYVKNIPAYAQSLAQLKQLSVFWVDGAATNIATPNPNVPKPRTVLLQPGWNAFVYTGATREVSDALAEIAGKYTVVLEYDNQAGAWRTHIPGQPRYLNGFGGLLELHIYWVYMTESATLTMK